MALLQLVAEQPLDQRAQRDPVEPGQPAGQLGVEQRVAGRRSSSARQGRSWEAACSTHSASARAATSGPRPPSKRDGVDQHGAGALPAQLHQVGPLRVAVAGRSLGVHGDRTLAGRDGLGGRTRARRGRRPPGARRPRAGSAGPLSARRPVPADRSPVASAGRARRRGLPPHWLTLRACQPRCSRLATCWSHNEMITRPCGVTRLGRRHLPASPCPARAWGRGMSVGAPSTAPEVDGEPDAPTGVLPCRASE